MTDEELDIEQEEWDRWMREEAAYEAWWNEERDERRRRVPQGGEQGVE